MASGTATAITLKPLGNVRNPIVNAAGILTQAFVQWLMALINSFVLITADCTNGVVTQNLPYPSAPNTEVFAVKVSDEGANNAFTLAAQGSDVINKAGAWGASTLAVGTTQGASARLKYDGNSNWYVI